MSRNYIDLLTGYNEFVHPEISDFTYVSLHFCEPEVFRSETDMLIYFS